MRVNFSYIKLFVLLLLVVFLFAFSSHRNANRKVEVPQVRFTGDENLFITQDAVSKLLIQNQETVTNKPKEVIDLNALEAALNSNPMIREAQVYMSVDGLITAEVEQKKPIARVSTNASYYIDEDGSYMPLSVNYSARVPLVTGAVEKKDLSNVYAIAQKVKADELIINQHKQITQKSLVGEGKIFNFTQCQDPCK